GIRKRARRVERRQHRPPLPIHLLRRVELAVVFPDVRAHLLPHHVEIRTGTTTIPDQTLHGRTQIAATEQPGCVVRDELTKVGDEPRDTVDARILTLTGRVGTVQDRLDDVSPTLPLHLCDAERRAGPLRREAGWTDRPDC